MTVYKINMENVLIRKNYVPSFGDKTPNKECKEMFNFPLSNGFLRVFSVLEPEPDGRISSWICLEADGLERVLYKNGERLTKNEELNIEIIEAMKELPGYIKNNIPEVKK